MILVDTSVWIDYLRETNSDLCDLLDELIEGNKGLDGFIV